MIAEYNSVYNECIMDMLNFERKLLKLNKKHIITLK